MDTALDLLVSLELGERTEDPCEHRQHDLYRDKHSGPGEWLVRTVGHGCPFSVDEVMLVCDKYKQMVFSDPAPYFRCSCGAIWWAGDTYTLLGRKGVDF